jgi:hypothetical protein
VLRALRTIALRFIAVIRSYYGQALRFITSGRQQLCFAHVGWPQLQARLHADHMRYAFELGVANRTLTMLLGAGGHTRIERYGGILSTGITVDDMLNAACPAPQYSFSALTSVLRNAVPGTGSKNLNRKFQCSLTDAELATTMSLQAPLTRVMKHMRDAQGNTFCGCKTAVCEKQACLARFIALIAPQLLALAERSLVGLTLPAPGPSEMQPPARPSPGLLPAQTPLAAPRPVNPAAPGSSAQPPHTPFPSAHVLPALPTTLLQAAHTPSAPSERHQLSSPPLQPAAPTPSPTPPTTSTLALARIPSAPSQSERLNSAAAMQLATPQLPERTAQALGLAAGSTGEPDDDERTRSGAGAGTSGAGDAEPELAWPDKLVKEDLKKPPHQRVFQRLGFAILTPADVDAEVPGTSRNTQLRDRRAKFPKLLDVLGVQKEWEAAFAAEVAALGEVAKMQQRVQRSGQDSGLLSVAGNSVHSRVSVIMLPNNVVQRLDFSDCDA